MISFGTKQKEGAYTLLPYEIKLPSLIIWQIFYFNNVTIEYIQTQSDG